MGNIISKKRRLHTNNQTTSENYDSGDGRLSIGSSSKGSELLRCPMSKVEAKRLHNLHYLLKHIFQTSYFAPVDELLHRSGSYVLDMGCGHCSTWIIEMAYDFPEAVFIGTDTIEPIAPYDLANVPDNIRFEKSFIFDQLNQPDNAFIFVHQRFMYTAYCNEDIPIFMKELKRTVKPGGYLELVETDIVPKRAGPLLKRVMDIAISCIRGRQTSVYHGPRIRQLLIDYGFQEIKSDYGSVPVCWGGYVGKLMYENALTALKLIGPTIYSELMDEEEYCETKYMDYLDKAFDECVEHQTFFNIHWAYGRKTPNTPSKA